MIDDQGLVKRDGLILLRAHLERIGGQKPCLGMARVLLQQLLAVLRGRGVPLLCNQLLQVLDRGSRDGRLCQQQTKQNSDETLHH